jgi:hypothetical protein
MDNQEIDSASLSPCRANIYSFYYFAHDLFWFRLCCSILSSSSMSCIRPPILKIAFILACSLSFLPGHFRFSCCNLLFNPIYTYLVMIFFWLTKKFVFHIFPLARLISSAIIAFERFPFHIIVFISFSVRFLFFSIFS